MENRIGKAFWVVIVAIVGSQGAVAQRAPSVVVDVGECIGVEPAADRFACYEAQVGEVLRRRVAQSAAAEPAAVPRPAPAPAAPVATARPAPAPTAPVESQAARAPAPAPTAVIQRDVPAQAASPAPASETRGSRRGDRRDFESEEFEGTVTALRETVPNSFVVTLDNGQIWRQTRSLAYPLRVGHKVLVYSTRWGGFRLTADELNGFIQVELVE